MGRGSEELVFNGDRVSFREDEEFWWMDGGDGYTTLCMYLMPLNCTLRNCSDDDFVIHFYHNFKNIDNYLLLCKVMDQVLLY